MSLGGSVPDAPNPAKRPERAEGVSPEDVVIAESEDSTDDEKRGRRALRRPAGGQSGAKDVGTGLSA